MHQATLYGMTLAGMADSESVCVHVYVHVCVQVDCVLSGGIEEWQLAGYATHSFTKVNLVSLAMGYYKGSFLLGGI